MAAAIVCVSPYRNDFISIAAGDRVTSPDLIAHLLNDSPGSFIVEAPVESTGGLLEVAAPAAPPVDKQIKRKR